MFVLSLFVVHFSFST